MATTNSLSTTDYAGGGASGTVYSGLTPPTVTSPSDALSQLSALNTTLSTDQASLDALTSDLALTTSGADQAASDATAALNAINDTNNPVYTAAATSDTAIVAATSSSGSSTPATDQSATDKANAAKQLAALLGSYGLTGNISAGIVALQQNGIDTTTALNILDSSDPASAIAGLGLQGSQLAAAQALVSSWQTRFAGNQSRIAAGLLPLDPATYIANEQSYKQVMTMAGIPANSPLMQTSYMANLIAADVSPAEVQMRVNAATAAVQNEDPYVLNQLQSQYGLSMSTIVSHLLDPTVSAPVVQQEVQAASIGAEATRAGVGIAYGGTGAGGLTAMQLAAQGVTQSQAAAGFQNIAMQQPAMQALAARYGGYTNPSNVGSALEASTFGTTVNGQTAAQAQQQLERLKTQEISAFSGSAGAATGSLGIRDTSGLS